MQILLENCSQHKEKWLELRKGSITGTMAYDAADLGEDAEPLKAWLTLKGREEEFVESEAAEYGLKLEQFVAEEFCRKYVYDHPGAQVELRHADCLIQHPEHKWMRATPDKFVVVNGELCPLQCKTTTWRFQELWEGGNAPTKARAQNFHEVACMPECYRGFLAAFIYTPTFRYVEVPREDHLIAELIKREKELYDLFLKDSPPAMKNPETWMLKAMFWESDDGKVELHPEALFQIANGYCQAAAAAKMGEEKKKQYAANLLQLIGNHKFAESKDFKVSIVRSEEESVSMKRIREEDPQLWERLRVRFGHTIQKLYPKVTDRRKDAAP